MGKTVRILAVLLGVQVLLAFGLNMTGSDISEAAPDTPLLGQSLDNLDEILIADEPDQDLVLKRDQDQWQLPALDGFPANSDQANQLLDALAGARQGIPVATSADAQARFKVAKADFKRRLVLKRDGDTLATVYLGSSPGTDQSYARLAGDNAIYRVKLAAYQAPATTDDWLDKEVLTVPIGTIAAIEVGDLTLTQSDGKPTAGKDQPQAPWSANRLPADKTLDTRAAATLAGQLAGLRIQSLVDDQAAAKQALSTPALTLTLDTQEGKAVTYTLARASAEPSGGDTAQSAPAAPWYLSVSDQDRTFRITSAVGETLEKAAATDSLLTSASAPTDKAPETTDASVTGDEVAE